MPIQLLLKRCSDERSWYFLIQIGNDKTIHVEQDQLIGRSSRSLVIDYSTEDLSQTGRSATTRNIFLQFRNNIS